MENQQERAPRLNHNGKDEFWFVKFGTPEYETAFNTREECLANLGELQIKIKRNKNGMENRIS